MKSILVPTDFSPNAALALDYACKIATKANAEVTITHICYLLEGKLSRYKVSIKEHNQAMVKDFLNKLNTIRDTIANMYEKINVKVSLYETEDIKEGILEAAKQSKADMIIMGTYGTQGVRRKLFGSKSAALINESEVPVLTIPPEFEWKEPGSVLLAVEDSDIDAKTLKPVFDISDLFCGKVTVGVFTEEYADAFEFVTHTKSAQSVYQKLKKTYSQSTIDVVNLQGASFFASLGEFISEKELDLVAMITRKRTTFLENILDSSVTQRMSYYSKVPLLSLHRDKAIGQ